MEKPAPSDYPINQLIGERWSPRAFDSKPIPKETIRALLEAARWAASASNVQPWRFLVGISGEGDDHQRMVDCLTPGNQAWAAAAPLLIISVAAKNRPNGNPNLTAWHDVGLATAQMVLQAKEAGIFAHLMGGIDRGKIRETWSIPEAFEPVVGMAFGYPGDPASLSEDNQTSEAAPRSRMPQSDFVFSGAWGAPASLD